MSNSKLRLHLNYALDNSCCFTHGVQKNICFQFFTIFRKNMKTKFKTYSYIQSFALNLMEILKITIYTTKNTQNTKLHFQISHFFWSPFEEFSVLCRFVWRHWYLIYIYSFYIFLYVEAHTAYLVWFRGMFNVGMYTWCGWALFRGYSNLVTSFEGSWSAVKRYRVQPGQHDTRSRFATARRRRRERRTQGHHEGKKLPWAELLDTSLNK